MIARTWHGRVPSAKAEAYHRYLCETGLPGTRDLQGNLGVLIQRRIEGDVAHFLFTSFWSSRDAIRAFAGDDLEQARYYPRDAEFLLEFEPTVTHYEVLEMPRFSRYGSRCSSTRRFWARPEAVVLLAIGLSGP